MSLALACALLLAAAAPAGAAPTWLPPQDLSAPLRNADRAAVEMDRSGGAIAVWEREGTSPFNRTVQASLKPPGAPFPPAVTLASPAQDPVLAMNDSGEAVAAWWLSTPTGYALQASVRQPGGSFGAGQTVAGLAPGFSGSPPQLQLEVNASGAAVLAWERRDSEAEPEERTIQASTRPAGGFFSAPETISDEDDVAAEPDVAIHDAGGVVAVWRVFDPATEELVGQVVGGSVAGGFTAAPQDLQKGRETAFGLDVAVSPGGNATIAFAAGDILEFEEGEEPGDPPIQKPTDPTTVEAVSGPMFGPFSAPTLLSDPDDDAFQPQLGMDGSGGAIAIWTYAEAAQDQVIQVSIRPPGGAFPPPGGAVDLVSPGSGSASSPSLSVNGRGAAAVVWHRGAPSVIQAAIRPPGGAFAPGAPISTPGAEALFADVSVGETGDAAAAWRRHDGAKWIAQAAGYDANPPAFAGVSIPPQGTAGVPVSFSAAPVDVWGISSVGFNFGDGTGAPGAAVSHVYATPGTYPVSVGAVDTVGNPVATGGAITIVPRRPTIKVRKRKRNKRKGTILLTVRVSEPGRVILAGGGVRRVTKRARRAGAVKLVARAKGKRLKRLNRSGKSKLRVTLTLDPDGAAVTVRRKLTLVLKKSSGMKSKRQQRRSGKAPIVPPSGRWRRVRRPPHR